MSKMLAVLTTLALATAAQPAVASSGDFRSPDARPAVVSQDFRSPDARPVSTGSVVQDLRSPDGQPSGRFKAAPPTAAPHASSSFDWAYLAILVTIPLLLIAGYLVSLRRGRDSVAVGS